MKTFINLLMSSALATSLCFVGCEKNENELPQTVVVLPSGEEITESYEHITPAETKYKGEGVEYTRDVKSVRIVSPFGVSPGEVISRQVAAEINTGPAPAINIKPEGIDASKGGNTEFKGGEGYWSFLDTIWQRIKSLLWIAGIGMILLFVLPIFFPVLGPIFSGIISAIGKFFAWLIPFFGGLVEWLAGRLTKKSAKQIVDGGTTFKNKVKNDDRLTEDVKEHVLNMFRASHLETHDEKTNDFVSMLKD
jgi:hypothetical protein